MKTARWFVSPPAAILYCLTALGVHEGLGAPGGLPAGASALASVLIYSSIALWVITDAHRRDRHLPYDFGMFVFLALPVVVPVYLFSTRGWRGFATIGWFLLLYIAAGIASTVLTWR